MDWIHWIGRSYYDIDGFIEEAKKYGITRRVSVHQLKQMSWGDVVYCAQREKQIKKGGSVFLYFPITVISGLSEVAQEAITDNFEVELVDDGGYFVDRGCGEYIAGPMYAVKAVTSDLAETLDKLKKEGEDIGKPMVGCLPGEQVQIAQPWPLLRNLPHSMGFRPFAAERFWAAVNASQDGKRVILTKLFYVFDEDEKETTPLDEGNTQVVQKYRRLEEIPDAEMILL